MPVPCFQVMAAIAVLYLSCSLHVFSASGKPTVESKQKDVCTRKYTKNSCSSTIQRLESVEQHLSSVQGQLERLMNQVEEMLKVQQGDKKKEAPLAPVTESLPHS